MGHERATSTISTNKDLVVLDASAVPSKSLHVDNTFVIFATHECAYIRVDTSYEAELFGLQHCNLLLKHRPSFFNGIVVSCAYDHFVAFPGGCILCKCLVVSTETDLGPYTQFADNLENLA